jgi:hypothetical protein
VTYKATVVGCALRQRLETKKQLNRFAGSKRGFRTVPLGTSIADGCGEHTINCSPRSSDTSAPRWRTSNIARLQEFDNPASFQR